MTRAEPGPSDSPVADPSATPVILALGSNLGDRRVHLRRGLEALERGVGLRAVSRLVESKPWGPVTDQPNFLNLVVRGRTRLSPEGLLELVREAELAAGRERVVPQGPRTLDVDIIFFGDSQIRSPRLSIPHPRWRERPFVAPLVREVAGGMIDPETGRPLAASPPGTDLPADVHEVEPLSPSPFLGEAEG